MGLCSINCSLILNREVTVGGTSVSACVCVCVWGGPSQGWVCWWIRYVLPGERAAAADVFNCGFSWNADKCNMWCHEYSLDRWTSTSRYSLTAGTPRWHVHLQFITSLLDMVYVAALGRAPRVSVGLTGVSFCHVFHACLVTRWMTTTCHVLCLAIRCCNEE